MEDKNWINRFFQEVEISIVSVINNKPEELFPTKNHLLKKYQEAQNAWKKNPSISSGEFTTRVNELCVAVELLSMGSGQACTFIEYERAIPHTGQTIDFFVQRKDGKKIYFDVKTIQPREQDDWEKYERGHFPINSQLILDQDFAGGEIFHDCYSARSKFLDYTLEYEEKIEHIPNPDQYIFKIVFCGDGFKWHQSHLEDFADFYRTGKNRSDDNFAIMETYDLNNKNITLSKIIKGFDYLKRGKTSISYTFKPNVYGPVCPWER